MQPLFNKILQDFGGYNFKQGEVFVWSPNETTIQYEQGALNQIQGIWSLLHEIGHGELEHKAYEDDLHLLMMEVQAWKKAKKIAAKYGIEIAEDHVESCIDSYREWLHLRSRCVECGMHAMQSDKTTYRCHNCATKWRVPASRICQIRKRRVN